MNPAQDIIQDFERMERIRSRPILSGPEWRALLFRPTQAERALTHKQRRWNQFHHFCTVFSTFVFVGLGAMGGAVFVLAQTGVLMVS